MNDKKIIIRNCPNITFIDFWREDKQSSYCKLKHCSCENHTDCVMKQIVEKCREADGKVVGYTKGKVYDSDAEKLIEADVPLMTKNPLAEEILDLLDIEECE